MAARRDSDDVSNRLVHGALAGAAAGLAAAAAMRALQAAWSAAGKESPDEPAECDDGPPTVIAADKVAQAVTGHRVTVGDQELADNLVHYGFGALLGAVYGAVAEVEPRVRAGGGAGFGAVTAVLADEWLVPAAGLARPPRATPAGAHAFKFGAHLLFGAVLEAARSSLRARG